MFAFLRVYIILLSINDSTRAREIYNFEMGGRREALSLSLSLSELDSIYTRSHLAKRIYQDTDYEINLFDSFPRQKRDSPFFFSHAAILHTSIHHARDSMSTYHLSLIIALAKGYGGTEKQNADALAEA